VGAPDRLKTFIAQNYGEHFGEGGIVVDNEDPTTIASALGRFGHR
jgi:hypothetical protein